MKDFHTSKSAKIEKTKNIARPKVKCGAIQPYIPSKPAACTPLTRPACEIDPWFA
jgi:hypothetical protein